MNNLFEQLLHYFFGKKNFSKDIFAPIPEEDSLGMEQVKTEVVEPAFPPIVWHGPIPMPDAKKEINLKYIRINGNKITFDYDKLPWKANETNTLICGFVMRDGKLEGGKFDWLRSGQKLKELKNLLGSEKKDANGKPTGVYSYYIKGIIPILEGESAWFCLMKSDGRIISDIIKATGTMPRSK